MKILVAEDDATSRAMLQAVLSRWGYEVVGVGDGDKAWALMQEKEAPQLALLDWEMPGIDGLALCRRLREQERKTPLYLILLTARSGREDIVQGLEAGADDYIAKPFDIPELRARVGVGRRMVEVQGQLVDRVRELRAALDHVKTLQGILPICMHCHKIRNDSNSWDRIEKYIEEHSKAEFSHGLCPECLEKHYPKPPEETENNASQRNVVNP